MRKLIVVVAVVLAACGDSGSTTTVSAVLLDPPGGGWVGAVDNPWLPLAVGSEWIYEAVEGDTVERIEVDVTADTRTLNGIGTVVVHDVVAVDGSAFEDTLDWYVQDAAGNVWYVGEDSKEIEDGEVVSTAGSWEWGIDGAVPGIIMYADPAAEIGIAYYQEFYEGEAEDKAEIVRTGDTVTVAAGTFVDVLVIREWNPLDPGVVELKYYARGVGVVLEEQVEGGSERVELISYSLGQ